MKRLAAVLLSLSLALYASVALGFWHGQLITYYVDSTSGSDSNNGLTPATAFQTISHINGLSLTNSTEILFNGGETFSGALIFRTTTNVANPGINIVLGSYGAGQPEISSGTSACITVVNVPNVTFNNFNCVGAGNLSTSSDGMDFANTQAGNTKLNGPTIINNTVSGYGGIGIFVYGFNGYSGWNNVNISYNTVTATTGEGGAAGIYVFGDLTGVAQTTPSNTNVTISNNISHDNPGAAGQSNASGSGILVSETSGATLSNNVAYNNGSLSNAGSGPVGIWAYDANNVTIEFNESYNNSSATVDGNGYDFDGATTNSTMEYNYSHGNKSYGYLLYSYTGTWSGNTLRYNISENDGYGIAIGNSGSGAPLTGTNAVYNNTVYNSTGSGCLNFGATANASNIAMQISNNIFYCTGSIPLVTSGGFTVAATVALQGNDYYAPGTFSISWNGTSYSSFSSWQTATGQEKISGSNVGLTSNPSLTNPGSGGTIGGYAPPAPTAYHLQHGSAMIGAGLNLNSQFSINPGSQDFYGDAIPNGGAGTGYNVGADGANR